MSEWRNRFSIITILLCLIIFLNNLTVFSAKESALENVLDDIATAIDDNAKTDDAVTQRSYEHYVRDSELFEYSPEWEAGSRKTLFQYTESNPTYTCILSLESYH